MDSGKEKRLLITTMHMVEGAPGKSAFFKNNVSDGGYGPV
jgi:hypothetical protein